MSSPDLQSIQFGVPLDDKSSLYFFGALGAAMLVVFLFSLQKFGESTVEKSEDDFIAQLPAKYLATREEYSTARIWYIVTMVMTLVAFSLLGPRALGLGGAEVPALAGALPLLVAFVLVGVLPNFPILQEVERRLRRFAHDRAFIPSAARATTERMAAAEFDFARYDADEILKLPSMGGVERADFTRPRGSLEYAWARLCCLAYEMQWGAAAESFGALDQKLINGLEERRQALVADVAQYRAQKMKDPGYANLPLHQLIKKTLGHFYILCGCAVRLKAGATADVNSALGRLGFVLEPTPQHEGNRDIIIVALAVMAAAVFVLVFGAISISGLWAASDFFPFSPFDPFLWAAPAVLAHGAAIFTAEWVRSRAIEKGRWFVTEDGERKASAANHIRVAVACAATGYVALVLWGLIFQGVTPALLKGMAAYALMPSATGAFYAFHLDRVDIGNRLSRWKEIAVQAVVTGFCGLVASSAWARLVGTSPAQQYDLIILVVFFGAVIGGSLAWYIPAAAPRKYDPLAAAKAERLAALRAAARKRFGDVALAEQWLGQPHAAFQNKPPIGAAATVEGYLQALGLLQGARPALVA
jgi:hypothetical protein